MNERSMRRKRQVRRRQKQIGVAVIAVLTAGAGMTYAWNQIVQADSFHPRTSASPATAETSSPLGANKNPVSASNSGPQGSQGQVLNHSDKNSSSPGSSVTVNGTNPASASGQSNTATTGGGISVSLTSGTEYNLTSSNAGGSAGSVNTSGTSGNSTTNSSGSAAYGVNRTQPTYVNRPSANTKDSQEATTKPTPLPAKVVLSVPAQSQMPQLPNGCEVTSLSMLFTAVGHPVNKNVLADEEPTDPTKLVMGPNNRIEYWGDPNKGFVGNVRGYGYGIYHGPIVKLINQILPGQAVDLTGHPFSDVLAEVAAGHPVMVWTTSNFQPEPPSQWITWNSPDGPVHATMWEHAVLVVGYDANHIYINDPLDGAKAKAVDKSDFIAAWKQLGEQAVTILPPTEH